MKRILLFACLIIGISASAQYTTINSGYDWIRGKFRALNIPFGCGYPSLQTGQYQGSSAIYLDTCFTGGRGRLYYKQAGTWQAVMDSTTIAGLIAAGGGGGADLSGIRDSIAAIYDTLVNHNTRIIALGAGGGGSGENFGEADTLFAANRYVNQAGYDFSYKSGKVLFGADKRPIGTRYNYSWGNNPLLWTTSFSTATGTLTAGTKYNVTGGAFNNNNSMAWNGGYIAAHNFTMTQDVVANAKNGTSYGFAYTFTIGGTLGGGWVAHYLLADTTGYVAFTGTGLPPYSGTNNRTSSKFIWSAGDTIMTTVSRINRKMYISMQNKRNGVKSELVVDDISSSVTTLSFNTYGGNWDLVGNMNIQYHDVYQPEFAFMGTSITRGAYSNNEAYAGIQVAMEGVSGGYVDLAASSIATREGTFMVDDIINYIKPKYVFVDFVVNDRNGSTPLDSFSKRTLRIVEPLLAAGITPILVTGVPQSTGSVVTYNDTLQAITNRYGLPSVVDVYTALVANTGTAMDAKFNSGDGIHPNNEGQAQLGNVYARKIATLTLAQPSINLSRIPVSNRNYFNIGLDKDGNLVKWYKGSDLNFIFNVGTPTTTNIQTGGINIANGTMWANTGIFGSNHQSGGQVKIDGTGIVTTSFVGTNWTVGSGANRVESGPGTYFLIAGKAIDVYYNTYFNMQGNPFKIRRFTPQAPAVENGIELDILTTGGGVITSTFKPINILHDGVSVANANRKGGWESDSTSKYKSNIQSLILANDRNIPDVGAVKKIITDSLSGFSGGGGSSSTIFNTPNGAITSNTTLKALGTLAINAMGDSTDADNQAYVRLDAANNTAKVGSLSSGAGVELTADDGTMVATDTRATKDGIVYGGTYDFTDPLSIPSRAKVSAMINDSLNANQKTIRAADRSGYDTIATNFNDTALVLKALDVQLNGNPVTEITTDTSHRWNVVITKSDVGLSNVDNTSDATKNSATANITNKTISQSRWQARVLSTTSSATPTILTDSYDVFKITALAVDITSMTTNLSGTPNDGDVLVIEITGTATRNITWGSAFASSTVSLPTATNGTNTLTVILRYSQTSSYGNNKWICANSF